jgi:leucyl aminopeptidase
MVMAASKALVRPVLVAGDDPRTSRPIWFARGPQWASTAPITAAQRAWLAAQGFTGEGNKCVLLPHADGSIAGAVLGLGARRARDPLDRPEVAVGLMAPLLPNGFYHLADALEDAELAAIAFGLGSYRFRRYKRAEGAASVELRAPRGADLARSNAIVEAIWLARDLINTPASDLGPEQLEEAARRLAQRHAAEVSSIVGEDLLAENFPMLHAVGRASTRPPRLIDLRWGRAEATRVTLVGKGICFDSGGLDIKPASAMAIMKKDMGGAASALALAHMVMSAKLDVRLRVLLAAADNSIAGNAFRPGDVLASRAAMSVEIGNTDAEGRLVLADALALADEEKPHTLLSFATLTGAARVAVGPDLAPFYTDDDEFARLIAAAGERVADPVWRMPFWSGYEASLESAVADISNVAESPFAGSVVAALFLRRFVKNAARFAHFDIYGWRQAAKALGPKGGEANAARAVFEVLEERRRPQGGDRSLR